MINTIILNTMIENNPKEITVNDFSNICRVCLQVGENMIDIFNTGIENKIMEVINLKVEHHDELPKSLCQKCNNQMFQLLSFTELAKSSDIYLRSLLRNKEISVQDTELRKAENKNQAKKTHYKKHHKKCQITSDFVEEMKSDLESDKIYLLIVPECDGDESELVKEIFIKELNPSTENTRLTNICRTFVKSNFSDHTYPKEEKNNQDFQISKSNHVSELEVEVEDCKTFVVNFDVYKCSKCETTYEELKELKGHCADHEKQSLFLINDFNCPVCDFSAKEKLIFMEHLKNHKEEGFAFIKVNEYSEIIPLKDNEKDFFIESFSKDCRIFSLSIDSVNCTTCSKNIQYADDILEHLQMCLLKEKSQIQYNIKYLCPVCLKVFINEKKNYIEHLSFHKKDNYYFVKVDSLGKLVKLAADDYLFVPFEDASKLFEKENTVFEILDLNSCDKCSYVSETFNELCEHWNTVHSEEMFTEISLCCPVCLTDYYSGIVDEDQAKFYEHLKTHKNEGNSFILVKRNGKLSEVKKNYSEIFTQSLFLWSFINSSCIVLQNILPELVILDEKDSEIYTCDLCKMEFKKKQDLIKHLKSHRSQEVSGKMKYICEKCGKKCLGIRSYKQHFLKHSKSISSTGRRSLCTICNKTFANKATLSDHMKHHIKEGQGNDLCASLQEIMCEKCGKSFLSTASLTKHKKVHLREKENTVLKCEICDRDFFGQSAFKRHISAHLNPKYLECEICKLPVSSVTSLQKHLEIHKIGSHTYDCKACKLSFLTKDSLKAHQTHTGHYLDRKPLECNVCHEKFFIGRKFSEHIKTHPKYKMGECSLCGKRLSTIQSLMLHMDKHFESNIILCPHCGKQFSEEKNYHRHLLTHEGIKPFSCNMEGCKKSFYTLFELKRHQKYHNNTRDFRCPHCLKSFHEANHLTVHIRIHTGERPYICPHCNRGFVTRTHCKHHIKLVHQGVGYDLIKSNISKKVTVFEAVETIV